MTANNVKVSILMGSDSDLDVMNETGKVLDSFGVGYEMNVLSAHRTPELVHEHVKSAKGRGIKIFVAGAGSAAHLAGAIAANTTLPVIGIPIDSSPLKGLDSLLATVQMPATVPVATVAIGKAGAQNAGYLAVQILALSDSGLEQKLLDHKQSLVKKIQEKNKALHASKH